MNKDVTRTEVMITVMTYPHPSRAYQEVICTAGVTQQGEWVRLYPIDYRYRPKNQWFRKYQWITADLHPRGTKNDDRKESRKPVLETIEPLGDPIPPAKNWAKRREIIDNMPHRTLKEWQALYDTEKVSLGIVRPTRVLDMKIEPDDPEWKPQWDILFKQMRLFGEQQKPLAKLPYKFSYVFECEDSDKPHNAMCEDWELGVLFLNEVERLGSEEAAANSVKNRYFNEICNPKNDTRFFMGTVFPFNTWIVLGTFYPKKIQPSPQLPLF